MNTVGEHTLYYCCVSTKPHPNLSKLLDTCQSHGLACDVLGMGDDRLQSWGAGLWIKVELLKQAIEKLDENAIVLFTDAYDVMCTASPAQILATFHSFGSDCIFSGEKYCHPDEDVELEYAKKQGPTKTHRYPFLNSGGFLACCGTIRRILAQFPDYEQIKDDQRYWTRIYLSEKFDVVIDHKAELFVCMAGTPSDMVMYKGAHAHLSRDRGSPATTPCFLHFNGWSIERYDDALAEHSRALARLVDAGSDRGSRCSGALTNSGGDSRDHCEREPEGEGAQEAAARVPHVKYLLKEFPHQKPTHLLQCVKAATKDIRATAGQPLRQVAAELVRERLAATYTSSDQAQPDSPPPDSLHVLSQDSQLSAS